MSVFSGWVIEQLRYLLFYFTFVCYECSQGLIMPLEAGENPGSPALTDTPGVGFSP